MIAFLIDAHTFLSRAVQIFSVLIALFALLLLLRNRDIGGDFWGAVVIGWGLLALQFLLGIVMMLVGLQAPRWVHYLYGVVILITWPATFAFTRGGTGRRELVIWATTSAFLFGATLRAVETGLRVLPF